MTLSQLYTFSLFSSVFLTTLLILQHPAQMLALLGNLVVFQADIIVHLTKLAS
jgi:hypothetical protein